MTRLGIQLLLGLLSVSSDHPSGKNKTQGFTLIELLIAAAIIGLVISLAGFGVVTATQSNKRTEAIAARRYDLSRAFDFISNEIRMATRINQTTALTATDSASMANLLTSVGLSVPGIPVLYLEVPITSNIPTICPADGPNAGAPPPQPTTYDLVVYDIRPSSQDWLGPNSIYRYGRIPKTDGTIDPCSDPVASDTLVDAISDQIDNSSNCPTPGILMGAEGFQVCVRGSQVDLFMRSKISSVEIHRLSSTATSRTGNSQVAPFLNATRQPGTNTVNLSWQWNTPGTDTTFAVTKEVTDAKQTTEIYNGSNLNTVTQMTGSTGDQHCYTVTASVGTITSPTSNKACFIQ
ncbi:MAG: prepilin-type N-terminal cleavage/methylation domain-containing protein [Acaryochloris sp. RU_4_1]|nr:prepilin-type N-terminal cleavage/methylation domain-containing protein [Acaryochloris sp. RU_4_1]NJR54010.1 prepilin-type N-terminal cleavage/methylation domain-containing protein [Acaryochloris sp. CRU_2_0]